MARLFILDTMYHIFRAYHALPQTLTSPDGRQTNAVLGALNILRLMWRTESVEYAVAVFESVAPTFRSELDPEYKANRAPLEPGLKAQVPMVLDIFERLGIPMLQVNGYEADDVMATLACRAVEAGHGVRLVSNDKDMAQVLKIGGDLELLRLSGSGKTAKVERVGPDAVESFFGVPAPLIPSWLALRGDPVDNIKGIPGIGTKTAVKLLEESGGLEALLEHPERAGKFADALRENKDRLLRDLEIATVRTDVPLGFEGFPLERFRPRPIGNAADFFREMAMKQHLKALEETIFPEPTVADIWST